MGDVAKILSDSIQNALEGDVVPKKKEGLFPPPMPTSYSLPPSMSATTLSRDVLKLNDPESASLPPIIPTPIAPVVINDGSIKNGSSTVSGASMRSNGANTSKNQSKYDGGKSNIPPAAEFVKINNKFISCAKKVKPWIWSSFSSSARADGLKLNHWVRQGVEYPDYPFARFDVHLEPLSYIDFFENHSGSVGSFYTSDSKSEEKKVGKKSAYDAYRALNLDSDENWTQSETDTLLDLCRVYELRWPVIIDRWLGIYGSSNKKQVCDLQYRYYDIGRILNQKLVERAAKLESENLVSALSTMPQSENDMIMQQSHNEGEKGEREKLVAEHGMATAIISSGDDTVVPKSESNPTPLPPPSSSIMTIVGHEVKTSVQPTVASYHNGTSNQSVFDLQNERQRRRVLEMVWSRSKEDEREEEELIKELKMIETHIRKLKKSGGHIMAAASAGDVGSTASGTTSPNPNSSVKTPASSRNPSPVPFIFDTQFASTAPTPTPGTPYLQSGRLVPPAKGGHVGINKTTLKRMDQVLAELNVNERPLPTKRVCDLYDHLRKGVLTLLTLQKLMLKKENEVSSRRMKLEKIAGSAAVAAAIAASEKKKIEMEEAAAAAANKNQSSSNTTSTTPSSGGKGKSNSGGNTNSKGSKAGTGSNAKSKGGSRKRAAPGEGGASRKRKNTSKKASTSPTHDGAVSAKSTSIGSGKTGTVNAAKHSHPDSEAIAGTKASTKRTTGDSDSKPKKRGRKAQS